METDVRAFLDVEAQLDREEWSHGDDDGGDDFTEGLEACEDESDEGEFIPDKQHIALVC